MKPYLNSGFDMKGSGAFRALAQSSSTRKDSFMQSNEPPSDAAPTAAPIIIKKYANRRLYNTGTSSYVTLDHLSDLVKGETPFVVQDAKSGEDITRQILTQIIFEHESRGQSVLPAEFLRQIIRFYGDNLQSYLPSYLNMSIDTFSRSRERMRDAMTRALGASNGVPSPLGMFEEQLRQNMTMFENAAKMFTPFAVGRTDAAKGPSTPAAPAEEAGIAELKKQLDSMQKKLDALTDKKP
jgi:polyhydroxyalkanoate synthesis repressor PhaR